jgi:hypothetical protein
MGTTVPDNHWDERVPAAGGTATAERGHEPARGRRYATALAASLVLCAATLVLSQEPPAAAPERSPRARLLQLQREVVDLLQRASRADGGADVRRNALTDAASRLEELGPTSTRASTPVPHCRSSSACDPDSKAQLRSA